MTLMSPWDVIPVWDAGRYGAMALWRYGAMVLRRQRQEKASGRRNGCYTLLLEEFLQNLNVL